MAQTPMQKRVKAFRRVLRELRDAANCNNERDFLVAMRKLKESLDRTESVMLTKESDGATQPDLFGGQG
jgi:hypothetical protein